MSLTASELAAAFGRVQRALKCAETDAQWSADYKPSLYTQALADLRRVAEAFHADGCQCLHASPGPIPLREIVGAGCQELRAAILAALEERDAD